MATTDWSTASEATLASAITAALQFLAGVCDGARSRDHQGFSGPHVHLGHSLARRSQHRLLTSDELKAAWLLCRTYAHRQLAAADLALPDQAAVERWYGPEDPTDLVRHTAGQITLVGDAVIVQTPFATAPLATLRTLKRVVATPDAWHSATKTWEFPAYTLAVICAALPQLERWFTAHDLRQLLIDGGWAPVLVTATEELWWDDTVDADGLPLTVSLPRTQTPAPPALLVRATSQLATVAGIEVHAAIGAIDPATQLRTVDPLPTYIEGE